MKMKQKMIQGVMTENANLSSNKKNNIERKYNGER